MFFIDYTNIVFHAYNFADKKQEVIQRKREILTSVFTYYKTSPKSILFVGFNPAIMDMPGYNITVTQISDEALASIRAVNPQVAHVKWEHLLTDADQFDAVIAMDEYLTFADSDETQRRQLEQICIMARQLIITTLRDYKNQGFKDREFSIPSVIRNNDLHKMFLEYHDYEMQDRNAWTRSVYEISGDTMQSYCGFKCRQMFFKQCAKFSIDAGAKDFLVHKNLMYKSLIKKNYEHVISIKFEQNGYNKSS